MEGNDRPISTSLTLNDPACRRLSLEAPSEVAGLFNGGAEGGVDIAAEGCAESVRVRGGGVGTGMAKLSEGPEEEVGSGCSSMGGIARPVE